VGADPLAGDGAGILIQIPDAFFRAVTDELGIELPDAGAYGVGMVFLPKSQVARDKCETMIERIVEAEGQAVLGWRDVPVDHAGLGVTVLSTEPFVRQVFIGRGKKTTDQDSFERKLFVIRKQIQNGSR